MTYYVSNSGSDAHSGRSPAHAWRTIARVDRAALRPGDHVLFRGGEHFDDSTLGPQVSGRPGAPIVYGSYGGGRALLPLGVYLRGVSALTFENLSISAPANGVLGSGLGPPDDGITIAHDVISNVGQFGIESADSGDAGWRIENNLLERTGNSGMYLEGESFLVTGNGILDTGLDGAIPYGRHGIYLKAIKATVTYNTITGFSSTGVSVRYRDSVIEHNVIDGGQIGIAWFQYDTLPGTSYWRENCILDTSQADIWVSTAGAPGGRVLESFVITGNALGANTEHYLELAQIPGTYTVRDNRLGARTCDRDGWGVSG